MNDIKNTRIIYKNRRLKPSSLFELKKARKFPESTAEKQKNQEV